MEIQNAGGISGPNPIEPNRIPPDRIQPRPSQPPRTDRAEISDHARFLAKNTGPYDMPNLSNDPTVEGGSIRFFDTAPGGDDETYQLPAANWSVDPMTGSGHTTRRPRLRFPPSTSTWKTRRSTSAAWARASR